MTDQLDMIYLKISLNLGLYQNHLRRIKIIYNKNIKSKERAIVKNVQLKIKC